LATVGPKSIASPRRFQPSEFQQAQGYRPSQEHLLKIVSLIARILLGALFVFAGSNHLFNFFGKQPLPPGPAGQFIGAMVETGYLNFIGVMEVIGGLLLLVNQFVPIGLTILGPLVVNIFVINALIAPRALPVAILAALFWVVGAWPFRFLFFPILGRKPAA
jgi:putative oxidoreductase